jgi:hypothetical protein
MQAPGPINNFALNSSRVGLELKEIYYIIKAFINSIRRKIARKYHDFTLHLAWHLAFGI